MNRHFLALALFLARRDALGAQTPLAIVDSVHVALNLLAREPMVVVHPTGVVFVAGYSDPDPKLFRSADRGRTWTRVNVGTAADGAIGNSDVDLAVAPDGTLYFAQLGVDHARDGTHIGMGVSRDGGTTWKWTMLSRARLVDRPWVEVAPDGTAHVIWTDTCGVWYTSSRDRGATWAAPRRINDKGASSHLAVGPRAEVAVRIIPFAMSVKEFDARVDLIVVSTDRGATWQKRAAPGTRTWTWPPPGAGPPRWVEPLAWDASSSLYYFWTTRDGLSLARSTDDGATWTMWRLAGAQDAFYPYLTARSRGELAATWFSGADSTWRARAAVIAVPEHGAPAISATTLVPDSWGLSGRGERPDKHNPAGEYLPITFLRDGGVAVVSPIQNERAGRYGFSWWRIARP
jgi:hypothetical protein